jgi:glycosyltransferase involved in cell wall biosynthesis
MRSEPLVSILIPTYNSEATIEACMSSIVKQTYPKIETIVTDGYSTDCTVDIARKCGEVSLYEAGLLGARYDGFRKSHGDLVLLLDSDQILEKSSIERAIGMMEKYDMLCFEEQSYEPKTFVEKLFEADRKLVHKCANYNIDPLQGVLLARLYKRQTLNMAFQSIPSNLFPIVIAHDHAIIYYEAYRVSSRVGILPKAIWHVEPSSLIQLWTKNVRYGRSTKSLSENGYYRDLLKKKYTLRRGGLTFSNWKIGFESIFLLALKGVAFQIGFWVQNV